MSFDSLLTHRITIERPAVQMADADTIDTDEMGNYVREFGVLAEGVPALVQPLRQVSRTLREIPETNEAGVDVGDYRVYLRPQDVTTADRFYFTDLADWPLAGIYDADEDTRLEFTEIKNAAGRGHHLEAVARLVHSPVPEVAAS